MKGPPSIQNSVKENTIYMVGGVREAVDPAQLVNGVPSAFTSIVNKTYIVSIEKESCVAENASDGDDSVGIGPFPSAMQERVKGIVTTQNVPNIKVAGPKRKRNEQADVGNEKNDVQRVVQKQRLSEEARVWQYVCRRSVFVSPPLPARAPDREPGSVSGRRLQRFPPLFEHIGGHSAKTTNTKVTVAQNIINVTLTKEGRVAQEWIEKQSVNCFGLDLEWRPNRHKGRNENKVALLQISTETECLLVQMLFLDSIPSALVEFLKDPDRKIAGVGIHGDTKKLERDYGLSCQGEVELTTLAVTHLKNDDLKRAGLKVLAKHVLGFNMNKNKSVTMSNWSKSQLDRKQVEYACMDAWVSLAIFGRLQRCPLSKA